MVLILGIQNKTSPKTAERVWRTFWQFFHNNLKPVDIDLRAWALEESDAALRESKHWDLVTHFEDRKLNIQVL